MKQLRIDQMFARFASVRALPYLILILLTVCCQAESPNQSTVPLWPDGVPDTQYRDDGDLPELIITLVKSEVPTPGVVILPGGGYGGLAIGHEGYEIADWLKSIGVSSAICTYRVRGKGNNGKGYGHPAPMMDAQRAIQTFRARAGQYNLDPKRIGVIGFSAGGHLCSTVSTRFKDGDKDTNDPVERVSSRPDFSILCYPVIAFGTSYSHKGSERNLLGAEPDPKMIEMFANHEQVSDQTPPTFLFHTAEDHVVPIENSVQYYRSCVRHSVPVEAHFYNKGRHGVGLAHDIPGASDWPKQCESWLQRRAIID